MDEESQPTGKERWRMLCVVAFAEMLAISVWLVSSAIATEVGELWNLTTWQSSGLATAVQIGFVIGTLISAIFNLADIWPNRYFFAGCAVLAAISNVSLIWCSGYVSAVVARLMVGVFMAGVYPPAMKMIATWFQTNRGFAIGTLVGALTLGKAAPFLIKAFQIKDWQVILMVSSVASLIAAALVLVFYREGPFRFKKKPFNIALIREVLVHRKTRLAIAGYLGHMWELYAMWTCIGLFLSAAASQSGIENQTILQLVTFSIIGIGAIGCAAGGSVADRFGRENFVNIAMLISGLCCIAIGFCLGNFWVCVAVALLWGFFVVADSAQFSTIVTEVTPQHAVGTALTLQTCLGFLLTTITIQWVPTLAQQIGWRYAFAVLALGPMFGIAAILKLKRT